MGKHLDQQATHQNHIAPAAFRVVVLENAGDSSLSQSLGTQDRRLRCNRSVTVAIILDKTNLREKNCNTEVSIREHHFSIYSTDAFLTANILTFESRCVVEFLSNPLATNAASQTPTARALTLPQLAPSISISSKGR